MNSVVIGATGMVGGYIVEHLVQAGKRPVGVSRSKQPGSRVDWITGDIQNPERLRLPESDTLYCTVNARLFSRALPQLLNTPTSRVVVISSTSIFTKLESEIRAERDSLQHLVAAEARIVDACEKRNIGWTILRPTLIYLEGRDRNITQISNVIRRLGFMPLYGRGEGLRQPVHAEDLALGAIAAASCAAARDKAFNVPGTETITYREMAGRVFDGLRRRRRLVPLPPLMWKAAFLAAKPFYPGVTLAMGTRMSKDMAFDASPAKQDFGWRARDFRPVF